MTCNKVFRGTLLPLSLIAAATILLLLHPAPAAAAGYPFLCRGQLVVNQYTASFSEPVGSDVITVTYKVVVQFRVNPTGAGAAGQNLEAGACAWVDRSTNSQEGTTLTFTFVYVTPPSNFQVVTQCSVTRNCVFVVTGTNPTGSALVGGSDGITTLFPAVLGYTIIPDPTSP
jgi:hypothetical protein